MGIAWYKPPPNMRLQLPGAAPSKGSGVVEPWRALPVSQLPCAGERVARSLSAIRWAATNPR